MTTLRTLLTATVCWCVLVSACHAQWNSAQPNGSIPANQLTTTDAINQDFTVSTATLTKTTDAALATVTGLSIPLTAGASYNCWGHITGVSGATGGVQLALNAGGGSLTATTFTASAILYNGATPVISKMTTVTALGVIMTNASIYSDISFTAAIKVNAAGNLVVQGAQAVSNATSTTFLVGSTFACMRAS
jgi:hypothetical protein